MDLKNGSAGAFSFTGVSDPLRVGETAFAWFLQLRASDPCDLRGLRNWLAASPAHRSALARLVEADFWIEGLSEHGRTHGEVRSQSGSPLAENLFALGWEQS
jgi:ferric-dicitrate binding protein FerR (iron transport regulator)